MHDFYNKLTLLFNYMIKKSDVLQRGHSFKQMYRVMYVNIVII